MENNTKGGDVAEVMLVPGMDAIYLHHLSLLGPQSPQRSVLATSSGKLQATSKCPREKMRLKLYRQEKPRGSGCNPVDCVELEVIYRLRSLKLYGICDYR